MALPIVEFDPFGGRSVVARPVRPDDLVAVGAMLARLSPSSRRLRFFSPLPRLTPRVVRPMVEVDHVTHEAMVAVLGDTVIGIAEFVRPDPESTDAEVAVVVEDAYQRHGVAAFLFKALARSARRQGVQAFLAEVLPDNRSALALARAMSPDAELQRIDGEIRLRIPIVRMPAPPLASV
ncbi:MAG TPA: GNAT family N-acetyltransferase [Acidimicrobiia bacterium]|nr:GNAT family N-acetyltransferase [Acidimicrobiia bacterium]